MKKVGFVFINSVEGGPRRFSIELLKEFAKKKLDFNLIIFTDTDKDLDFLKQNLNIKLRIIKRFSKYDLLIWEQILIPFFAKKENIDVLHGTKNSIPFLGKFKKIATIHDLAYYIMPETFSFLQRIHLKLSCFIIKKKANIITAVSNNTKKDIIDILNIPEEKIKVIYNGINEKFFKRVNKKQINKVKEKYNLPDKFILHVGTLQPRKNIKTIIESFFIAKKEIYDLKLVLIGRKGWYYKEILKYIKKFNLKNDILFLGFLNESELLAIYNMASIFIYLSNYDGFGLAPLEAMAAGIPTIVSNVSSLPEVVEDAAIKVNPKNAKEVAEKIILILKDKDLYKQLKKKGPQQALKFSWEKSALEYIKLYKQHF